MAGPLSGLTIVELAGIGPGPFAAMTLADLGADVVRVERPGGGGLTVSPEHDITNRNKRSVLLDLKTPDGVAAALALVERADVLIEGFRPGVAERLGVGPEVCLERNPRLVYGRMTGWGQDGPLAPRALVVRAGIWCSPCGRVRLPPERCRGHVPDCMDAISVEQVVLAADELLDDAKERSE